jgi:tyrosyl-tRNA synthetase
MLHLYRAGHRPIFLLGGGTTMIGDPSGKSDMRQMLTLETINSNVENFRRQFSKFVNFADGSAIPIVSCPPAYTPMWPLA